MHFQIHFSTESRAPAWPPTPLLDLFDSMKATVRLITAHFLVKSIKWGNMTVNLEVDHSYFSLSYEEKIGKIDCCRFSFTPSLHQVKEKENKKTKKNRCMHEKNHWQLVRWSDACFRQEVIPLNATLACIPFQLGASTVKSDRHGPNVDPPVSEKERLSEAKQKSEEWRAPSTAVTPNGKMEALDANCAQ